MNEREKICSLFDEHCYIEWSALDHFSKGYSLCAEQKDKEIAEFKVYIEQLELHISLLKVGINLP